MKTRKIKVALYKNSKSFFGFLIRLQQRLQGFSVDDWKYSHAEIVFCDLTREEKEKIKLKGCQNCNWFPVTLDDFVSDDVFFSSSETDGGVRFKNIIPKKDHWDFVEIEVSEKQYQAMLNKALEMNGKEYSKWGIIFAQALNLNLSDTDRYFCSQTVSILLHEAFGTKFSREFYSKYNHFINPAKLSKRLRDWISLFEEVKLTEEFLETKYVKDLDIEYLFDEKSFSKEVQEKLKTL